MGSGDGGVGLGTGASMGGVLQWLWGLVSIDLYQGVIGQGLYCPPGIPYRLFGLSMDSTQTLLGILLAEHPANFKFLVLVQS